VVVRDGRAITAGVPDYRQLDFAPLPPPLAGVVPNGIVAPRPTDRLLEGEDAAAQAALDAQVMPVFCSAGKLYWLCVASAPSVVD
jgi:hypothetical protein